MKSFNLLYYVRKKLSDPPIISTAQHTYFCIDCQRPYPSTDSVHGICMVWPMKYGMLTDI